MASFYHAKWPSSTVNLTCFDLLSICSSPAVTCRCIVLEWRINNANEMLNKVYSVSNNLGVENENKNLHDVPYCKIVKLTWMYQ